MKTLSTIPTRRSVAPGGRARSRVGGARSAGRGRCATAVPRPLARRRIVIAPAPGSPLGAFARPGGMRTNTQPRAPATIAGRRAAANPRIEITPSAAQYKQLCRDLAKLRRTGAPSHTAAIVAAVHAAAAGKLGHERNENAGQR